MNVLTYANISSLDHGDVVGTISDGQRAHFQLLLDHLHNVGLLKGRGATAQHRIASRGQLEEWLGQVGAPIQDVGQRLAVDNQGAALRFRELRPDAAAAAGRRISSLLRLQLDVGQVAADGAFSALLRSRHDLEQLHLRRKQLGRVGDVDGGLRLVASHHPNDYAGRN